MTFYSVLAAVTPAELRAIDCPLLAMFAEHDPATPPEQVESLRRTLEGTTVAHHVVVYPGVERGFFDDSRPVFDPDSAADAWTRALEFFNTNLEVEPPRPSYSPGPFEPGSVY